MRFSLFLFYIFHFLLTCCNNRIKLYNIYLNVCNSHSFLNLLYWFHISYIYFIVKCRISLKKLVKVFFVLLKYEGHSFVNVRTMTLGNWGFLIHSQTAGRLSAGGVQQRTLQERCRRGRRCKTTDPIWAPNVTHNA